MLARPCSVVAWRWRSIVRRPHGLRPRRPAQDETASGSWRASWRCRTHASSTAPRSAPDCSIRQPERAGAGGPGCRPHRRPPSAVELLVPLLTDSAGAVQNAPPRSPSASSAIRAAVDPLLAIVRSVAPADQSVREIEAVTALAKIGGPKGAQAIRSSSTPRRSPAVPPIVSTALLEAWRLGCPRPHRPAARLCGSHRRRRP